MDQYIDATITALKEILGSNVINKNVERQARSRIKEIVSGKDSEPAPKQENPKNDSSILEGAPPEGVNAFQKKSYAKDQGGASFPATDPNAPINAPTSTSNASGGPGTGSMRQTGTGSPKF